VATSTSEVPLRSQAPSGLVGAYLVGSYYVLIFDQLFDRSSPPPLVQLGHAPVAFLALVLDAKLLNGDWPITGRVPVASDLQLPAYKEEVPTGVEVVDWTGRRRRAAKPGESEKLRYREVVSPAFLELAVKAKHGVGQWYDDFGRNGQIRERNTYGHDPRRTKG
jgi:hypothetical protein